MIKTIIRDILADTVDENLNKRATLRSNNLFDRFLGKVEDHFSRQVHSLSEMKNRDSKKEKGRFFEEFCQLYLKTTEKYQEVWLWEEIPENIRMSLKLTNHLDNGIDIIAKLHSKPVRKISKSVEESNNDKYVAIQCKYRGKIKSKVPWGTLATFVGLCAVSGPWLQTIVMTNCCGVTRKVERVEGKDKSICYGTFRGLERLFWMKMAGDFVEHRISDETTIASSNQEIKDQEIKDQKIIEDKKFEESLLKLENLRNHRLEYFSKLSNSSH